MGVNKIMFIGNFSFTKSNREGHGYNFVEFFETNKGEKAARPKTLFADSKIDVSGLTPGDIVECKFSAPTHLGGKSSLVSIIFKEKGQVFNG